MDEVQRNVERELFVRSLMKVNARELRQILSFCRDVSYQAGQTIYAHGTAADNVYFIAAGGVELTAPDVPPWRFEGQSVVGILDALIGRAHTRTATAMTDVRGIALRTDDYFDVLEDNSRLVQRQLQFVSSDLFERFLRLRDHGATFAPPADRPVIPDGGEELSIVERLLVIRNVRAFSGASTQGLASIAESCTEARLAAGERVFDQGDPATRFWMIARGQVEISRTDPAIEVIRGPGELIENYAPFGFAERQYTATCRTDVTLLTIDREDLLDRLEEHFALMRAVFSFLALEREVVMNAARGSAAIEAAPPTELTPALPAWESKAG